MSSETLTFLIGDCEIPKWRNSNDSVVSLKAMQAVDHKLGSLRKCMQRNSKVL